MWMKKKKNKKLKTYMHSFKPRLINWEICSINITVRTQHYLYKEATIQLASAHEIQIVTTDAI